MQGKCLYVCVSVSIELPCSQCTQVRYLEESCPIYTHSTFDPNRPCKLRSVYFAYFQRRVGAAPQPRPRLSPRLLLGGERRGPTPPDEGDDGWGMLSFGLEQMEGAVGVMEEGVRKMKEGLGFLRGGIGWQKRGVKRRREMEGGSNE